jgi:glutamate dehydrogenase
MSAQPAVPAPSLAAVLEQISARLGAAQSAQAQAFASHLFRRVDSDDLGSRGAAAWAALALGLLEFIRVRRPGVPSVRVFNPNLQEHGWESPHSIVEIVTDDAPFLVDSVGIAIAQSGLLLHTVIHPVFMIERDPGGHLLRLDVEAGKARAESLMHVEIDRIAEPTALERLRLAIVSALQDVAHSVRDWGAMRERMLSIANSMAQQSLPISADHVAEAQEFLRWVANDHFTFLGYREYRVASRNGDEVLEAVEGSGLGILHESERSLAPRSLKSLAVRDLPPSASPDVIILTKTNARASVHRPGHMDYIGVLEFDTHGVPTVEHRFLGLYASGAYTRRPWDIPLVRQKYEQVMERSGLRRDSHSGKALRNIIETLPRDELFQASVDELFALASGILQLQGRARSRLFVRSDRYGRFFSCLIFIPRDRFTTEVRERIENLLKREFRGERLDSTILVGESALARLHLIIRPKTGDKPHYDVAELEAKIAHIVRNWHDELREILLRRHGEDKGTRLAGRFGKALPAGYIEEVTPHVAATDVEHAASLKDANDLRLALYRARRNADTLHFKLYRYGAPITLSDALPMLENMGLRILSEHPYEMDLGDTTIVIQDFDVQTAGRCDFDIDQIKDTFAASFERIWRGQAENDGFNRLIMSANMDWRQVSMLRGLCKYLLQTGVPFSQSYMEETLNRYPLIAGLLVELFEAKFDPDRESPSKVVLEGARKRLQKELEALLPESLDRHHALIVEGVVKSRGEAREAQMQAIVAALRALLENVASLDEDRILRAYLGLIGATLRTSYFQTPGRSPSAPKATDGREGPPGGKPREYIAFKFDPARVPDLPKPRPYREIFVCAPRVEGVHLRFGPVARGGLRWSDRREDFRTEVLGLVKAQMVKNTVIVPVGSKGGFFVKRPPASGDRDAVLAEGVACYRLFINGLLDITDNLVEGEVVHPQNCVRHDADDPYLVVAADKGTATFSDIANAISAEHGYWLGDAFASGGSVGYDHKGMGITAKGAWESVKRHFRALGRDCQSEDFTCVGIGDMSGDVFGNGMLLSRHTRLIAAFDHRHIFIDPDPDAASSFAERERMFKLPRSSWADYDTQRISRGGGIYPRTAKSIALSAEARGALGIEGDEPLSPNELLKAILKAPVDLLWNVVIGTYIKAES